MKMVTVGNEEVDYLNVNGNRSKNASISLMAALAFQLFHLVMGLIVPRFIIITFGSDINGLTSTISRILSLIGLLQAGAVGASIYSLYKPVAEADYDTIGRVIHSSQKYFKKIGIIYSFIGCAVAVFYAIYLQSSKLTTIEIFISFVLLIINGASYIFITSIFDIVFSSYQKRYYLSFGELLSSIVYYGCVAIVIICKWHFIFLYVAYLSGTIAKILYYYITYKRKFASLIGNPRASKDIVINNRNYLVLTSVGEQAVGSAPTVIVTTIIGLVSSSVFSIYSMVYLSVKAIISQIDCAISPIFGNLVATSDNSKISNTANILQYIFCVIGSFLSGCVGFLIMPFVSVYTQKITDANYYCPELGVFITLYVAIFAVRQSYYYIAEVYGLFKSMCKITLSLAVFGILISIFSTLLFGMPYVMIGILLYQVMNTSFTVYVLRKNVEWIRLNRLVKRLIFMSACTAGSLVFSFSGIIQISNWISWLLAAISSSIVMAIVCLIYSFVFEKKEITTLLSYFKIWRVRRG